MREVRSVRVAKFPEILVRRHRCCDASNIMNREHSENRSSRDRDLPLLSKRLSLRLFFFEHRENRHRVHKWPHFRPPSLFGASSPTRLRRNAFAARTTVPPVL